MILQGVGIKRQPPIKFITVFLACFFKIKTNTMLHAKMFASVVAEEIGTAKNKKQKTKQTKTK